MIKKDNFKPKDIMLVLYGISKQFEKEVPGELFTIGLIASNEDKDEFIKAIPDDIQFKAVGGHVEGLNESFTFKFSIFDVIITFTDKVSKGNLNAYLINPREMEIGLYKYDQEIGHSEKETVKLPNIIHFE